MNNERLRRLLKRLTRSENDVVLEGEENNHVVEISGVDHGSGWSYSIRDGDDPDEWTVDLFKMVNGHLRLSEEAELEAVELEITDHFEGKGPPSIVPAACPVVKTPLNVFMEDAQQIAGFFRVVFNVNGVTLPPHINEAMKRVLAIKVEHLEPAAAEMELTIAEQRQQIYELKEKVSDARRSLKWALVEIEKEPNPDKDDA